MLSCHSGRWKYPLYCFSIYSLHVYWKRHSTTPVGMKPKFSARNNSSSLSRQNLLGKRYSSCRQLFKLVNQTHSLSDDGSQPRCAFKKICEIHDVEYRKSGTQYYRLSCIGEKHNERTGLIFTKTSSLSLRAKNGIPSQPSSPGL